MLEKQQQQQQAAELLLLLAGDARGKNGESWTLFFPFQFSEICVGGSNPTAGFGKNRGN